MDISQLKSASRPLKVVLDDGDGNVLGEITFRYRPAAVTKETLPAFIAIDDEPLARAQRAAIEAHLEREREVAMLAAGEVLPANVPFTMESLLERIDARRAQAMLPRLERLEIAAQKLCLLLDPDKGHDLTHEGKALPVTWQTFADHLPVELIEAVTLSVLEAMKDPFGLVSSLQKSLRGDFNGTPDAAPANGES